MPETMPIQPAAAGGKPPPIPVSAGAPSPGGAEATGSGFGALLAGLIPPGTPSIPAAYWAATQSGLSAGTRLPNVSGAATPADVSADTTPSGLSMEATPSGGSGSVWRPAVMARLDRAILRGTVSGSDGPVRPGHDGENGKPTRYPSGVSVDVTPPGVSVDVTPPDVSVDATPPGVPGIAAPAGGSAGTAPAASPAGMGGPRLPPGVSIPGAEPAASGGRAETPDAARRGIRGASTMASSPTAPNAARQAPGGGKGLLPPDSGMETVLANPRADRTAPDTPTGVGDAAALQAKHSAAQGRATPGGMPGTAGNGTDAAATPPGTPSARPAGKAGAGTRDAAEEDDKASTRQRPVGVPVLSGPPDAVGAVSPSPAPAVSVTAGISPANAPTPGAEARPGEPSSTAGRETRVIPTPTDPGLVDPGKAGLERTGPGRADSALSGTSSAAGAPSANSLPPDKKAMPGGPSSSAKRETRIASAPTDPGRADPGRADPGRAGSGHGSGNPDSLGIPPGKAAAETVSVLTPSLSPTALAGTMPPGIMPRGTTPPGTTPLTPPGSAPATADVSAAPPEGASSPTAQVTPALVHVLTAGDGARRITVRLDPAELGQVQIRIDRAADGGTHVTLSAERPETLRLLSRDEAGLRRVLDQAGLPPEGRSISFHVSPPPLAPDTGARPEGRDTSQAGSGPGASGPGGSGPGGSGPGGHDGDGRDTGGRHGGGASSGGGPSGRHKDTTPRARRVRAGLDITA